MKKFDYSSLDFDKMNGIVPAVVQDSETGVVLMVGFMNKEALEVTLREKKVTFWSRTKKRLWQKGETSGHVLNLVSLSADCDNDALLILAKPTGSTCHTGSISCFENTQFSMEVITELFEIIQKRKKELPNGSYTAKLFKKGLPLICNKVEEEAEEVVRAACSESDQRLVGESVDLLYHLFVLLAERNISIDRLCEEAFRRRKLTK